jgi:hypothetical protein
LASALSSGLTWTRNKFATLVAGLRAAGTLGGRHRPAPHPSRARSGLVLQRVSCRLGVWVSCLEARPDALVQISALPQERQRRDPQGRQEALQTNRALTAVFHNMLESQGLDPARCCADRRPGRRRGATTQHDLVDLVIARGSSEFVHYVRDNTQIPVMAHATEFVTCTCTKQPIPLKRRASPSMRKITLSRRVQRRRDIALGCLCPPPHLMRPSPALREARVESAACEATRARHPELVLASEADVEPSMAAPIISVRQVLDCPRRWLTSHATALAHRCHRHGIK